MSANTNENARPVEDESATEQAVETDNSDDITESFPPFQPIAFDKKKPLTSPRLP